MTCETLFVEREGDSLFVRGLREKARLTRCFICASRAWLAYDYEERTTRDTV